MKQDSAALMIGGAAVLLLMLRGKASASNGGSGNGEAAEWPPWQESEVLDVTPNVPPIKDAQPPAPAPLRLPANLPRGDGGGLDITGPRIRPSSPAEIQDRLGRPPNDDELEAYESWAAAKQASIEADKQSNARAAAARKKTTAAATPPKAVKSDAGGALAAAKLAAAAKPTAPPQLQAKGNQVADALRSLVATPKVQAQAAPAKAPKKTAAKPAAATPKKTAPAKPAKKVAAPAGVNVALAKQTAPEVATHIRNKKEKYTTSVVKLFQQRAGLKADGLYGPVTASALRYFGANAPAPLFKGVNAKYVPPT